MLAPRVQGAVILPDTLLPLQTLAAPFAVAVTARWCLFAGCSAWHLLRRTTSHADTAADLPPVDVLVPAYNEDNVLRATVQALLDSTHPRLTIYLADDGSTDDTAQVALALAAEHPTVHAVLLPRNGGKAAALNAALAAGSAPHVVTIDADTLVAADAVRALCHPMLDPDVGAVAGNVAVGNRDTALERMQAVEYITALHLDRRALDVLGCITTVPGAAGGFRRSAVDAAGGWSGDTQVEDTDLTLALLRAGHRVVFAPDARTYTEAPSTLRTLLRQRARWLNGYLACLYKHRGAFFRANSLGWIGLPYLLYGHVMVFVTWPYLLWAAAGLPFLTLTELGAALTGVLSADLALGVWAAGVEPSRTRELAALLPQRVLWPWLQVAVLWTWARQRMSAAGVAWGTHRRRAQLATAYADGAAPGVIRRGATSRSARPGKPPSSGPSPGPPSA